MVAYGWKPLSRARLDHNGYFFSFLEYDNCQCRCNALFISSQFREKNSVFAIEKFQFFVHQEYHNVTTPNSEIPTLPFSAGNFSANISGLPFSLNILPVFKTSLLSTIFCRFSVVSRLYLPFWYLSMSLR